MYSNSTQANKGCITLTVVINIFGSFIYSREYLVIGCHDDLRSQREGEREREREKEKERGQKA